MATAKKENEGMTTAEGTAEKKVKLRIPRTKSENDDVYVSVNDRSWLIRRGEEVEVRNAWPRCCCIRNRCWRKRISTPRPKSRAEERGRNPPFRLKRGDTHDHH